MYNLLEKSKISKFILKLYRYFLEELEEMEDLFVQKSS